MLAPNPHFSRPAPRDIPLPERRPPPTLATESREARKRGAPPALVVSSPYLSCALRNLKAGAFEEPHHLHLQPLLGRRRRPQAAQARHGGARALLAAQTLRVARATARSRPRRSQGGGRRGAGLRAGRAAAAGRVRLLLVSRARGERGREGRRGLGQASGRGTGSPAPLCLTPARRPSGPHRARPSPPVSSQASPQIAFPAWWAASLG